MRSKALVVSFSTPFVLSLSKDELAERIFDVSWFDKLTTNELGSLSTVWPHAA
jgi:hypothetical protein